MFSMSSIIWLFPLNNRFVKNELTLHLWHHLFCWFTWMIQIRLHKLWKKTVKLARFVFKSLFNHFSILARRPQTKNIVQRSLCNGISWLLPICMLGECIWWSVASTRFLKYLKQSINNDIFLTCVRLTYHWTFIPTLCTPYLQNRYVFRVVRFENRYVFQDPKQTSQKKTSTYSQAKNRTFLGSFKISDFWWRGVGGGVI